MADLVLDWSALGAYGTNLDNTAPDAVTTTVETGGVAVDITFTAQDDEAQAFTVTYDGYVPEGSDVDPNSHLKLFGAGGDGEGIISPTSTTVLDFSASDEAYGDNVQNVSFLLNDVDGGSGGDLSDLAEYALSGTGPTFSFQDNVTVLAYDAEGNPVDVTMTVLGAGTSVTGDTATGTEVTNFAEQDGTVQVNIAGPVSRIEVVYENGGNAVQGVLISDVSFSTTEAGGDEAPIAVDDAATTDEDVPVVIDVLGNDSDPEGGDLSVTGATATNGTVTVNEDNTLTFTPDPDYNGPAEITYTIEDPTGNTATGTVDVTVNPVNDAPVAVDDSTTTGVNTPVTLDPSLNDTDVDGDDLAVTGVTDPTSGTVVLNDDGTVTYTPEDGYTGDATFDYTVSDGNGGTDTGTVTVTVGTVDPNPGENDAPTAVEDLYHTTLTSPATFDPTLNDTDPDGDELTVTSVGDAPNGTVTLNDDGTVTFVADEGFTGYDSFAYTIDDGNGGTASSYVTVEVQPCFTPGTLIATPQGERLVEDLEVGDRVITRDNGIQEIRWIGRKDLTGHELARKPHLRPVLIQQGALGKNLPEHDLLVSPNHRVLVANDKTALYFEEREVLAAAKHLTGLDGVDEVETLGVTYIHMMFDNHEVVLSNGAWSESFQPGDHSLKGIGDAQRQEIFELFPELEHEEGLKAYGSARRSLKKHEAQLLTK
ncbi:Ig-like domain-containing protein [Salipiger sp. P9]|uniref:Ig-like domain-containing protein n=1 Tax=Salipiger pentaromativorans TaxID=2943193 RepID=UPI00215799BC|nr:Hint domain-containing protein [Salipiger pentaromativorans]MCR8547204.1 Ig-like domain-containing protein [Salipiger pentaromativorans]